MHRVAPLRKRKREEGSRGIVWTYDSVATPGASLDSAVDLASASASASAADAALAADALGRAAPRTASHTEGCRCGQCAMFQRYAELHARRSASAPS